MTQASDMPGAPRTQPAAVARAVLFLWIVVGIGAVSTLATFAFSGPSLGELLLAVIGVAITAFLISKIAAGRNWARIVLLVLYVIGVLGFVLGMSLMLNIAPVLFLMSLAQLALEGFALFLLFTPPGSTWFKVA